MGISKKSKFVLDIIFNSFLVWACDFLNEIIFYWKPVLLPQSIKNHYHVFTFHTKSFFFWLIYIIFVGSLLLKWNFINSELKDNFCVNNPRSNCYFTHTNIYIYIYILLWACRIIIDKIFQTTCEWDVNKKNLINNFTSQKTRSILIK